MEKQTCKDCKRLIDPLEYFPDKRCIDCHEAVYNQIPVQELEKPDFTKAVNV